MRLLRNAAIVFVLFALACDPATPTPVRGGGIRGTFEEASSILVLDELESPRLNVEVIEGEGADASPLGTTDVGGHLRVDRDVDVVSATLPDKTAVTIAGANAEVVTLALVPSRLADRASVLVSVPGFDQIALEGADYVVARGGFTPARTIDAPVNRVAPLESDTIECVRGAESTPCDLSFSTRVGEQRIVVGVARGTDTGVIGDPSDDTLEPIGLFASELVDLAVDATLEVDVAQVADADLLPAEVRTSPPEGFRAVVGVPGSSLDEGVILWPFNGPGFIVRSLDGQTAGDWVVGEVRNDDQGLRSRVIARAAGFAERPLYNLERQWLDAPSEVRLEGSTIHMAGDLVDAIVRIDVFDAQGVIAWTAFLLDGRPSITPPASFELPSSGIVRAMITEADRGPPGEISFASVEETWTRRASRSLPFETCPWARCR